MNRVVSDVLRMAAAAMLLFLGLDQLQAQGQKPNPAPGTPPAETPAQPPAASGPSQDNAEEEENPFAPEPAAPLPPGMVGSDAGDPRAKLNPGLYDAGETSMGLRHLLLLRKPEAFQLGATDPDDPRVQKTLGQLGIGNTAKLPKPLHLVIAQLAFANSDFAFQGNHLFQGNFYGVNIYDISNPASARLVTSLVCPGGQGDVSVYKNLLFMSVEMPNGRLDCGVQGFRRGLHRLRVMKKNDACQPRRRTVSAASGSSTFPTLKTRSNWRRCKRAAGRIRIRW